MTTEADKLRAVRAEIDKMEGLKRDELKHCALCNRGVMHDNNISFYRITIQQFLIDVRAVQQQAGLELMMGGHAAIAHALGPDANLAKAPCPAQSHLICQECALMGQGSLIMRLWGEEQEND